MLRAHQGLIGGRSSGLGQVDALGNFQRLPNDLICTAFMVEEFAEKW